MKLTKQSVSLMVIMAVALLSSCSKKNNTQTPTKTSNPVGFWSGSIGNSPNQVGVAFLIRNNSTIREYDNDFFTPGTFMTAADTANAAYKIDGSYSISPADGGKINITMKYSYTKPNQQVAANTFSNVGVIDGNTMTGTWTDHNVSANINTVNNFTLALTKFQ